MSKRLDPPDNCRTTDHGEEIAKMREVAKDVMTRYPDATTCPNESFLEATVCQAAAALLEVHDATGISLDDWVGPRELVETGLMIAGYDRDEFLPNGI